MWRPMHNGGLNTLQHRVARIHGEGLTVLVNVQTPGA